MLCLKLFTMLTCLLSCFSLVCLFGTLWTAVHHALLSMGFSRQEYWSGLPCPHLRDLPNPRIELTSPKFPKLQEDSLLLSHEVRPLFIINVYYLHNQYKTINQFLVFKKFLISNEIEDRRVVQRIIILYHLLLYY